ncbi:hypothetical protein Tco_1515309 [Tanacetum coccineum]
MYSTSPSVSSSHHKKLRALGLKMKIEAFETKFYPTWVSKQTLEKFITNTIETLTKTNVNVESLEFWSAGRASDEVQRVMDDMQVKPNNSFELAYNTACPLVEEDKLSDAEQLLLSARRGGASREGIANLKKLLGLASARKPYISSEELR